MFYKTLITVLLIVFFAAAEETCQKTCSNFSEKEVKACMETINKRIRITSAPLKWSCNLAKEAQKWADYLAEKGLFKHEIKDKNGENIYAAAGFHPSLIDAIRNWYSEKRYFVYGNKFWCEEGHKCGHYTQLIWKTTKEIGCGISKYKKKYKGMEYVIVCKFSPPGNILGEQPF